MAAPDIVVTGIGAFSPLGTNALETWTALLAGESGARTLEFPWVEELGLSTHFAATAKLEPTEVLDRIEAKRLDRGAQLALIAARDAWADAGAPDVDPTRLGVDWATGIGGVWTLLTAWDTLKEKGARRVPPMTVPMLMPNAAAAAIEMEFKARAGARTVVSACASSNEAIGNALDHLRLGYADVIIAGGTEASPWAPARRLRRCRRVEPQRRPRAASRRYDAGATGSCSARARRLVLEPRSTRARGAKIYAGLLGGAVASDASHQRARPGRERLGHAPCPSRSRSRARRGRLGHINAHATSTPAGDVAETKRSTRSSAATRARSR